VTYSLRLRGSSVATVPPAKGAPGESRSAGTVAADGEDVSLSESRGLRSFRHLQARRIDGALPAGMPAWLPCGTYESANEGAAVSSLSTAPSPPYFAGVAAAAPMRYPLAAHGRNWPLSTLRRKFEQAPVGALLSCQLSAIIHPQPPTHLGYPRS
jgi:hypothetical protein